MSGPILEAAGATAGYGGAPALENVSFRVSPGEFVGVIGPNGAGKTTLVRVCAGVLRPEGGTVLLNGRPAASIPPARRAREAAFLPADVGVLFPYTVEEFVGMGRFPYVGAFGRFGAADRAAVERALSLLGVAGLRSRPVGEVSDGERQRICLAQALAQEAPLLILDEPTSHLDVGRQSAVMNLLADMNRDSGMTVVSILHDLNLAAEFCSRLLLLSGGRLAASGPPAEVLTARTVREVYGADLPVLPSPRTGRPHVFPSRTGPATRRPSSLSSGENTGRA